MRVKVEAKTVSFVQSRANATRSFNLKNNIEEMEGRIDLEAAETMVQEKFDLTGTRCITNDIPRPRFETMSFES